ncbi:purple acid phosphatase 17-like [Aristolochia californica]|uniref:purple acid phosphatase 17-like n=1 Tax=Aristolochia californica TaxID=171875 RepID=UPI0035E380CF
MVHFSRRPMESTFRHLFFTCLSLCLATISMAELRRFDQPRKVDGSVSFLVVGDWGRRGKFNQTLVAYQMGVIGEKLDINFVISTGDNFYDDGLTGIDDPAFEESFMSIYTAESLNKRWYNVLGNHDYRGDAVAQLSPFLREIDSRWLCLRSFLVNTEIAEFFFVDTTPFVKKYFTDPEDHVYDWRDVLPREEYIANVLKDLEAALKESQAKWKIVVGHHTIRSVSHHGDTEEIVDLLLPMLRAHNVDFYVNGHDHCLQRISDTESSIQFLTSGGGSEAWRGDMKSNREGLEFFYDGQGFMYVGMTEADVNIVFYDVFGTVLHQFKTSKQVQAM